MTEPLQLPPFKKLFQIVTVRGKNEPVTIYVL
jgi:hypothetical protein